MKTYQLGLLILILSSCGGGSSSSSQDISIPPESNDDDLFNETCIDTSRSGMKRCDLKHDNLDRFYYVILQLILIQTKVFLFYLLFMAMAHQQ